MTPFKRKDKLTICVVDTETTMMNEYSHQVFDFAYVIGNVLDSNCEPLERSFLIDEVLDEPKNFIWTTPKGMPEGERKAFALDSRYETALKRRTKTKKGVSWEFALDYFYKDCSRMGVDVFTAYNVKFDIEALRKTQDQINDKRFRMPNGMNIMCLMDIAQTKVINNDFHNWFNKQDKYLQNQFTTDNDNISYSAECVFRYWFDNYYYKEQHTALRDARMEWKLAVKMFERWEGEIKRDFINFVVNLGWRNVNKIPSSTKKAKMRKEKRNLIA